MLGVDPVSGNQIVARDGRYGPYVTEVIEEMTEEQIQAYLDAQPTEYYKNGKPKPKKKPKPAKPRTASLFKSMDLATVTLEQALQLMSLPRVLGTDAEGVEITVQNGRFGPYLKKGTDSPTRLAARTKSSRLRWSRRWRFTPSRSSAVVRRLSLRWLSWAWTRSVRRRSW